MGKIIIKSVVVGVLATNCYVIFDEDIKEALIVDPGASPGIIDNLIKQEDLKPASILLTHAHLDHIGALEKLKELYDIPMYIHKDEVIVLENKEYNLSHRGYTPGENDIIVDDGQVINPAGIEIKVIHTPGHTPGGCCYYIKAANALISGDTMFCCSWGRTDFPGGDERALMKSIREKLLLLPEDTLVYPGHDCSTTIGNERRIHGYR